MKIRKLTEGEILMYKQELDDETEKFFLEVKELTKELKKKAPLNWRLIEYLINNLQKKCSYCTYLVNKLKHKV